MEICYVLVYYGMCMRQKSGKEMLLGAIQYIKEMGIF